MSRRKRRHPIPGKLAVCAEPCKSCPWVGRMELAPGALGHYLAETIRKDCHFTCHGGVTAGLEVVCRGWMDKTAKQGTGQLLRIMERLDGLAYTTPEGIEIANAGPNHNRD